ncbi:SdpC family antimicrobial peptide [Curtobacterium flaccumfaciens]|nr:hypothetical protein [Curtobacterium flaccumfaciens]MDQ0540898.1 SdpC family antimicrobial peptide [Curtobacterium flaccumfaciens]
MFKKFALTAATVALALGATAVTAVPASATTPTATSSSTVRAVASSASYSDTDVIGFLATGTGAIAREFPNLVPYIPVADGQAPTRAQISELTTLLKGVDPKLHSRITVKLQSGDPYVTAAALQAYRTDVKALAKTDASTVDGTFTGDCLVVLAAGVLLYLAVATKVWYAGSSTGTDGTQEFAAALATSFQQ